MSTMETDDPVSSYSPGRGVSAQTLDLERSVARTSKVIARRNLKRKSELNLSDADLDESMMISKPAIRRSKKKVKTKNGEQEIIINMAGEDLELNLAKQYEKNVEFCDREESRIHEPAKSKKERGSVKDDSLKYIEFQAGLFVALKGNLVRILKEMGMELSGTPSVDTFGSKSAEIRICFNVLMKVDDKDLDIKVKVYVTRCSIDFQACGKMAPVKIRSLGDKTGGEYFVEDVMPKVVMKIKDESIK